MLFYNTGTWPDAAAEVDFVVKLQQRDVVLEVGKSEA
jgi:hypothetical protein